MTYRILAQLLRGSHKSSVFSPVNKHLRVRHHYAYEIRLEIQEKIKHLPRTTANVWIIMNHVVPVNYLRARTPAAQEHNACRHFLSSPERCTLPGPTWRCASSCRWCVASHSGRGKGHICSLTGEKMISVTCRLITVSNLTGSHWPTSPLCSQPSLSNASAVLSGSFR